MWGGVEKALISILNEIDYQKYKVTVLLLKNNGGFLDSIPKCVEVKILEKYETMEAWVNNPPIIEIKKLISQREYRNAIKLLIGYTWYKLFGNMTLYYKMAFANIDSLKEEYDVAIAFTSIISYLTYFVKYKVKASTKIGWIHFDVNKLNMDKKTTYSLHKDLKKIYVVSKEAYKNFVEMFPGLKDKCEVKYNLVSRKYIEEMSKENVTDPAFDHNYKGIKIVTLGRLSKEKGQDIIPEIAFRLKEEGINYKWYLIGDGYLRAQLEEAIAKMDLEENIILLGTKINPYPYLAKADIYVQTSVYEGFCISLAEAKALCLPIISTKFTGAKEQIINSETGSIVTRNVEEVYKELLKLILNENMRRRYRHNLAKEYMRNNEGG